MNPVEQKYQILVSSCKCSGSCNVLSPFNSTFNSNQKLNNETCQCESKNYCMCKKDYIWNSSSCTCENSKYFHDHI